LDVITHLLSLPSTDFHYPTSVYDPLQRAYEQPDRETTANAQSRQHQEKGLPGHALPKSAEKPGEVVAEEARKKPDAHLNNYFRLIFELRQALLTRGSAARATAREEALAGKHPSAVSIWNIE
jgi:hypothetical protein